MATRRNPDESKPNRRPPAKTPEAREQQMVSLATELAEKQLRNGTASSMVVTHYLKLATMQHALEKEKLRHENELLQAKADAMAATQRIEELYTAALGAMKSYAGDEPPSEENFDD